MVIIQNGLGKYSRRSLLIVKYCKYLQIMLIYIREDKGQIYGNVETQSMKSKGL